MCLNCAPRPQTYSRHAFPRAGHLVEWITAAHTRLSGSAFHRLLDVPSDEWESCWTLHVRSAPAALREEEADHLGGGVGASRIGVGPDWASPEPRVPAAVDRPGLGEDDAVGVGVHGAGAGVAGGPLVECVVSDDRVSAVASRAATRLSAFTGATIAVAVAVEHDQRHFAARRR